MPKKYANYKVGALLKTLYYVTEYKYLLFGKLLYVLMLICHYDNKKRIAFRNLIMTIMYIMQGSKGIRQ